MTKYFFIIIFVVSSNLCFAQSDTASITVTGNVKASACMVDLDSKNVTVYMNEQKTSEFRNVGDSSPPVSFGIVLTDCPATTTKALVKLDGIADSNNPNLIRLDSGEGSAQGIGIAVYDSTGKILPLWTASSWYNLQRGDNILSFTARYVVSKVPTVPGIANATSDFTLNYQ